jgi:hypothetical protein
MQPQIADTPYDPADLDILARAYDRALETLAARNAHETEALRATILAGLLQAAQTGERDELALTIAALNSLAMSGPARPTPATATPALFARL